MTAMTQSTTFYLCFYLLIRRLCIVGQVILFVWDMCGDKSTTFYLCFYLLIRRLLVWECGDKSTTFYLCFYLLIKCGTRAAQVNHVLFVFLSFLLIRRLCSVGHVWRQVNHVLFVFLSFH